MSIDLDSVIRKVPDFPKPGILFYDITGILASPAAFSFCIDRMDEIFAGEKIDAVAAIEARGFVFAAPFALRRQIPLILVRKKGKLPGDTYARTYDLEYGAATLEAHKSDVVRGARVLVVDDLVATGGTIRAACDILRDGGAEPMAVFAVVGLGFLDYQGRTGPIRIETLVEY